MVVNPASVRSVLLITSRSTVKLSESIWRGEGQKKREGRGRGHQPANAGVHRVTSHHSGSTLYSTLGKISSTSFDRKQVIFMYIESCT